MSEAGKRSPTVVDRPELRERLHVFRDRQHAGEVLAALLAEHGVRPDIVLAVPAGGVPVGQVVARKLRAPLDLAVVSKVTPSWNTEIGYGAVAWDGSVRLEPGFIRDLDLAEDEVRAGIRRATEKVARRVRRFHGDRPFPDLSPSSALLVDDGLASGFTLRVAAEAVRRAGARTLVVAVPTGHGVSAEELAGEVEAVYCANIRSGLRFAVAEAYQHWDDLDDDAVAELLAARWRRE